MKKNLPNMRIHRMMSGTSHKRPDSKQHWEYQSSRLIPMLVQPFVIRKLNLILTPPISPKRFLDCTKGA